MNHVCHITVQWNWKTLMTSEILHFSFINSTHLTEQWLRLLGRLLLLAVLVLVLIPTLVHVLTWLAVKPLRLQLRRYNDTETFINNDDLRPRAYVARCQNALSPAPVLQQQGNVYNMCLRGSLSNRFVSSSGATMTRKRS